MSDPFSVRALAAGHIHVWTVMLLSCRREVSLEVFSNEERFRAERFVHERDRGRYLASHWALRRILAGYCGAGPERLWFEVNAFGKPSLGNSPEIEFNLSHSGDIALIAVRTGGRVGVDVEEVRSEAASSGVAERFFSSGELQRLVTLDDKERVRAFFRCWTRKEAYLKALGCGISDEDLVSVEVTLLADEPPAILRRRPQGDGGKEWTVFHLEPKEGFIGAVAAEGPNLKCSVRTWERQSTSQSSQGVR